MILYGPETKIKPDSNAFKQTTRFPLNRPARRIRTVPGVIDLRILGGCLLILYCIVFDDNLFEFRYNIFTSWKILKGGKWVSDGVCIFPIQIVIVSLRGSFCIDQVVRFYIVFPSSLIPMTVQSTEVQSPL